MPTPRTVNGRWIAIPFAALVLAAIPVGFWVRSALAPPVRVYPAQPLEAPDAPAREATRVAALSPALALILDQVGAGDLVVARHGYDAWSDQGLPVVGDQAGIDYEALLRIEPTVVLIEWGSRDLPVRLTDLASEHGWSVYPERLLTLQDIARVADRLAADFGSGDAGPPPSEAFWAAMQARDGLERVGRVLLLMSAEPPQALGPGSAHYEMLVRLGATPAIVEGMPWIELDAEDVLRLAPDAIVLIQPGGQGRAAGEALGVLAGLEIPAVESGRVAVIGDATALLPTLGLAEVARHLGEVLEGWAREEGDGERAGGDAGTG